MFPKATLLSIVTLAIHAAAVPVEPAPGISIPLHKRGCFTTADGVFDHSKAIRASVITRNKYRQNLISYTANGGTLRQGSVIKELATVSSEVTKRQSEPLIDEKDTEWAGMISVGTPAKQFLIDFDSTRSTRLCSFSVILIPSP